MDEFLAEQALQRTAGMPGWWERAEQTLEPDQWASLVTAADNPAITHRTISVVLGRWGVKVSPGMVGHWRRNVR